MADFGFITREDLKAKMDRGDEFVLLEILGESSYRKAHLPGALRLQDLDLIPELLPDKNAEVVTYCSSPTWHASTGVARELAARGYENVFEYEGGKSDWTAAGLPTESGWEVRLLHEQPYANDPKTGFQNFAFGTGSFPPNIAEDAISKREQALEYGPRNVMQMGETPFLYYYDPGMPE